MKNDNAIANTTQLLTELQDHASSELLFEAAGLTISPGYHVTEIKHGKIQSIDCGRGSDQWSELVIQLLDGSPDSTEPAFTVGKFRKIISAAQESLPAASDDDLYFEFAIDNGPLQKMQAASVRHQQHKSTVLLTPATAVCKPAQRFWQSGSAADTASSCCASQRCC